MAIETRRIFEQSVAELIPVELLANLLEPYQSEQQKYEPESIHEILATDRAAVSSELAAILFKIRSLRSDEIYAQIVDLAVEYGVLSRLFVDRQNPTITELLVRAYLYAREEVFDNLFVAEDLPCDNPTFEFLAQTPVQVDLEPKSLNEFACSVTDLIEDRKLGSYCEVQSFPGQQGVTIRITRSDTPISQFVADQGCRKKVRIDRTTTDTLHYNQQTGKLEVGTNSTSRVFRSELCSLFAIHLLRSPGLFDHPEVNNFYSLAPLVREGAAFRFYEGLLPDDTVDLVELNIESGSRDIRSTTTLASEQDLLDQIARGYQYANFQTDELISAVFRFSLVRNGSQIVNRVRIQPPGICRFSSPMHAGLIRSILQQNGFMREEA